VSIEDHGPGKSNKPADILKTLVRSVPDEVLQSCFPDMSPEQVKMILLEAARKLDPSAKVSPEIPASKSPKTAASQGDWSGKITGQTLSLYTDGASRGNPGEAGGGISIVDEQGSELFSGSEYLGQCTNNEAEYRALLHGLANVRQFGCGRLAIYLDSELIVRQILGQYKVKNANLKSFFTEAMQRLDEFPSYSISHIRREKNSRADHLANLAIDDHLSS
jgi:ribonuclease HI